MIINVVYSNSMGRDDEKLFRETNGMTNIEQHRNNIYEVEDNILLNGKYKRGRI